MALVSPRLKPRSWPPAIWLAFAQQAAWKNWVLVLQLGVIAVLALALAAGARRDPDVVLVTPEGKSTYLARSVANEALLRFLADQKAEPSDVTIQHFSREFLRKALAFNSDTVDESWIEALSMMSKPLRQRMQLESSRENLLGTLRLAQVRTELLLEELALVERTGSAIHVRATLSLTRSPLAGGGSSNRDRLEVDLIEHIVPRTSERPDGLEVTEWRVRPLPVGGPEAERAR